MICLCILKLFALFLKKRLAWLVLLTQKAMSTCSFETNEDPSTRMRLLLICFQIVVNQQKPHGVCCSSVWCNLQKDFPISKPQRLFEGVWI